MTTALVVIDVQESFRRQASWADISAPDIVERTNRLVDAAHAAGDLVVWVLHESPGSGGPFDPVNGLVRLQPDLRARQGDLTVVKTSHNAFTTTNLTQHLTRHDTRRLRISGIRVEQCVETTARLGSDMGYDVEVVIDACGTHPLALADGSGVLTVEQVTERTAAALAGRFATITTVEQVVGG
ncbi:isochorismatase family protein [Arsenicicoccus sp. oral taxon 190]|uniref:isochorismatase family protein n=1 Tax=Arsenicicoccus sp. oral taxon 190 TaxID=1658671 RepID=UPI00067A0654|nr:isochorismatase family protein [Arsenicicoccus sp. oral taxon 190]AKT51502.1 isochorismatase [Arsenicicoccus sp. oral taxon 190]